MAGSPITHVKSYLIISGAVLLLDYFWIRFPARIVYAPFVSLIPVNFPGVLVPAAVYLAYTAVLYLTAARPASGLKHLKREIAAGAVCGAAAALVFHGIAFFFLPPYSRTLVPLAVICHSVTGAMACGIYYNLDSAEDKQS